MRFEHHHFHHYEPRRQHADSLLLLVLEHLKMSTEALNRLTAAVATVGANIQSVAQAIRDHPAASPSPTPISEDDSAALNELAGRLEAWGQQLSDIAAGMNTSSATTATDSGDAGAGAPNAGSSDTTTDTGTSDTSSSTGDGTNAAGADGGAADAGSATSTDAEQPQ
jgi:hypothetical protein